jgi:hypothetical protein
LDPTRTFGAQAFGRRKLSHCPFRRGQIPDLIARCELPDVALHPGNVMRRRDFMTAVAGSAAAWPIAARAQQPAMPVIGFLSTASPDKFVPFVDGFRQGLKRTGYVEGENVGIEYRWSPARRTHQRSR